MPRVLIVDDHEENLTLLRATLEYHGVQVDAARDGAQALLQARREPPDLVISDLLMPVMDGFTLLRHWKADERLQPIPFVVYTSTYTDTGDQRLARDLGADAFIVRPLAREAFMAQIDALLARQQHGDLVSASPPPVGEPALLEEYNAVLVRKLEAKSYQLTMTNRALREDIARREQAEAALRESEQTLRLVTDSIDEVFWMAEVGVGALYYISPSYERVWGRTRASLRANPRSFLDAVHPDDLDRLLAAIALQKTEQPFKVDYRVIRPDGTVRWIWDRGYPVRDETGKVTRYTGVAQDITERKQAEEALRASEARYRTLIDQAAEAIVVAGPDGRMQQVNARACELFGYAPQEFVGVPLRELVAESELDNQADGLRRLWAGERIVAERQFRRKDGSLFPGELSACKMEGGLALGLVRDITERRRTEQALIDSRARLETLTRRLLDVQESERRLIASELHDEVGGALTAMKLNLQALLRTHPAEEGEAALVDSLALVDGAIQSVRSLSLDLRPAVLDDLGLIPALKWYCERQARRAGVAIELALDAIDLKAVPQLESACFRIVQEAVTNALRHAGARHVKVTLRREDGRFALEIADDGGGFDPAAALRGGLAGESSGLLGMEERARLLGGHFEIDSTPGAGTRVRAEFVKPDGGFA